MRVIAAIALVALCAFTGVTVADLMRESGEVLDAVGRPTAAEMYEAATAGAK